MLQVPTVKSSINHQNIINFLAELYMNACRQVKNTHYTAEAHQKSIYKSFEGSKFFYQEVQQIIQEQQQDFIADLLEVTEDLKQVIKNYQKSFQKFKNRSFMHFSGEHYKNLQIYNPQSSAKSVKKVLNWYQNEKFTWSQEKQHFFANNVYPNCVYIMGLTKGNGVLIGGQHLISCAHVFLTEKNYKLKKIRCFSTAVGGYGVVQVQSSGVFRDQDVCFGTIIAYQGPELPKCNLKLIQPLLKFQQFKPLPCLQVGLFFVPDECCQTFETFEGFIQRNQYQNIQDISLNEEMGLLVHNCYGMWGTSGSPLWSSSGELIGIHNAWNENGHNVSMMVRDGDQNQCRVIRQYERRAISVHVLLKLQKKWRSLVIEGQKSCSSQSKNKGMKLKKIRKSKNINEKKNKKKKKGKK